MSFKSSSRCCCKAAGHESSYHTACIGCGLVHSTIVERYWRSHMRALVKLETGHFEMKLGPVSLSGLLLL